MKNIFNNFGFGLGLRAPFIGTFMTEPPRGVDWVEALTENYLNWKDDLPLASTQRLLRVREHLPVVLHGVALSIGSPDPLNLTYLERLRVLADQVQPLWISDHLCWTGIAGHNSHDLLPLPYTADAVNHVVDRIQHVQDFLGRRILLENVSSYIEWRDSAMPEWEFLKQIVERADCGILLDLNNVFVSSMNHDFSAKTYLRNMPWERVGQIHIAGHSVRDNFRFDTHDQAVCDDVWQLVGWCAENFSVTNLMIERDDKIPPLAELLDELETAKKIVQKFTPVVTENSRELEL